MKSDIIVLAGQEYESVAAVMERLDIKDSTVKRYIELGRLPPPIKIGNRRYFEREAVDRALLASA